MIIAFYLLGVFLGFILGGVVVRHAIEKVYGIDTRRRNVK